MGRICRCADCRNRHGLRHTCAAARTAAPPRLWPIRIFGGIVVPQEVRGLHQILDVRGEVGMGEITLAGAEAGEIETQDGDAVSRKPFGDSAGREYVLRASETMGEERKAKGSPSGSSSRAASAAPCEPEKVSFSKRETMAVLPHVPCLEPSVSATSKLCNTRGSAMTDDNFQLIEKTTNYQGYFRIERYRFRHRLFAGGWSGEIRREVFERGHAVAVLPYDPERDAVLLIEQFRIGALAAAGMPAWQIEVIAGIIDEGETPEAGGPPRGRGRGRLRDRAIWCRSPLPGQPGRHQRDLRLYCGAHRQSRARRHPSAWPRSMRISACRGRAVRRGARHAGERRDRQCHRADRPAVAGAEPRRAAKALALGGLSSP